MEKPLTLQEVCDLLGCTDPDGRMVRNLWKSGKSVGAKFGRRLMFEPESVKRYITDQFRRQNP